MSFPQDEKKSHDSSSRDDKDSQVVYSATAAEDDFIPNSEGVTQHDLDTLRHVKDSLPFAAWLVIVVEFAERWTYYGTTNIYNNYMRFPLPEGGPGNGAVAPQFRKTGIAGALGLGVQKSYSIRTFNSFFVYVTPFVGGIIADLYLGRYKTILLFSLICFLGHVILVGSATPSSLQHPDTALGLLVFSILVMGLGAGGIKANVSPMIAEQYNGKLRKETLPSGEVVIRSPTLTIESMYLWFYLGVNMGSLGAISASFLARDQGYWVAFLVPTCIFILAPLVTLAGRKKYVKTPPRGSVLLEVCRVINMCLGPNMSWNPVRTMKNIRGDSFWDPAKPSHYAAGQIPMKITWDEEFVGEVARTVSACKALLFMPFFWLCYSQIDGNLSIVASGMTLNGSPNDLILNLNPITLIVFIPIMDMLVYPALRKYKINFSPIKRITAGFFVAAFAMIYAAVLQAFIFRDSPCHDNEPSACETPEGQPWPSKYNVWIVSGPYILVGISEIFASVTVLEYAFTKAPKSMKSIVMAFGQFQVAIASLINLALASVNVEQKFVWLFGSFAIVSMVTGTIFFFTFRKLDRAELKLNAIGTGERSNANGEHKP